MLNQEICLRSATRFSLVILTTWVLLLVPILILAQSTVGTGSIQGIVTDQTGAAVSGVRITITNKATAQAVHLTSSSTGTYSSGPIQPGDYPVRVESKGFKTVDLPVTVLVGNTASGNVQIIYKIVASVSQSDDIFSDTKLALRETPTSTNQLTNVLCKEKLL